MARDNVEIAMGLTDALNRMDSDAYADLCTADFEWRPMLGGTVEGKRFRGRKGVEEYFGELRDAWEEFRFVVDEFRDLGDRVLLLGKLEGRGRGSGVQVALPVSVIVDARDGKAWRARIFNHGDALRAAGLSE